jgi:hypothetical protein
MLADTSRMLSIRRNESDVIHSDLCSASITAVPYTTTITLADAVLSSVLNAVAEVPPGYEPYARFLPGKKAIIVCANPSNSTSMSLTLNVPLAEMGCVPLSTVFNVVRLISFGFIMSFLHQFLVCALNPDQTIRIFPVLPPSAHFLCIC